jgi:plastocyanin
MNVRVQAVGLSVLLVPLVAGCGSGAYGGSGGYGGGSSGQCSSSSATATTTVMLQNISFRPSCFKIPEGSMVTFTNGDTVAHTVTTQAGQPETFDSGTLQPGTSFQHTFNTPGTIAIYCRIHGLMMQATVVVESAGGSVAGPGSGTLDDGMVPGGY